MLAAGIEEQHDLTDLSLVPWDITQLRYIRKKTQKNDFK
ncbi:hypothetical protein FKM82_003621 [Ascaphus truei]